MGAGGFFMRGLMIENRLAQCYDATGSHTSAALLYRMLYWHPRMRLYKGGSKWIFKSREDWCHECRLTVKEYNNAIRTLKDKGLIESKQGFLGRTRMGLFRLTEHTINLFFPELSSPTGTELSSPTGTDHIQGVTEHGVTIEESLASSDEHAGGSPQDGKKEVSGEEKKEDSVVSTKTVMEIAAQIKAKTSGPVAEKPMALGIVWKEQVADTYGVFVPSLTGKQIGLLGHFLKKVPKGRAEIILRRVIQDWIDFVSCVKADVGISTVPAKPSLEFLVKHAMVAVEFAKPKKAPTTFTPAAAHSSAKPADPQNEDAPMSLGDFLKLTGDE